MEPHTFMADAGIQGLCSLRGITRLEILDMEFDSLEESGLARWLKEMVEGKSRGKQQHEE
jgi:hypothetical protein